MALDPIKNFAKVTVSTGYDSAATSITLNSGDGNKLPDPATDGAFNLVWWNATDYPDPSDDPNVEIVRVTAKSGDTLTITRGQEGTSAADHNTSGKTYKMVLAVTEKTMSDINSTFIPYEGATQNVDLGSYGLTANSLTIGSLSGVLKASSGVVSGGAELNDLSDVNVSSPSDGDVLTYNSSTGDWENKDDINSITFVIRGGGSAIETGEKGHLSIPFDCEIQSVTLLADQSGSIQIDIWKSTYANFPPTSDDSICGSSKPAISNGVKYEDTTLSGWTKTINAGDILAFNVDSCDTIMKVTISLKVKKI